MSHFNIAVFSNSEDEVIFLLAPYCSSKCSNNLKSIVSPNAQRKDDMSVLIDGYVIYDCHIVHETSINVQAFITAEGVLVQKDKILWESSTVIKGETLFYAVLNRYLSKAKKKNMFISLVDCHL